MIDTSEKSELLKKYASYNKWANEQLANWLLEASEIKMNTEIESSFNTLIKTIKHIWNAEYGWLQALQGAPWGLPPKQENCEQATDFIKGWIATSDEFETFILSLPDKEFYKEIETGKDRKPSSKESIILHVFNHSTYHRGQLITMGRQAGLDLPPRTDFIYYIAL